MKQEIISKICPWCELPFEKPKTISKPQFAKRLYCSRRCRSMFELSRETPDYRRRDNYRMIRNFPKSI